MNIKNLINTLKEKEILKRDISIDLDIDYISYNSSSVKQNTLFICKGMYFKESYLDEAIKSGATCYISTIDYQKEIPCILVSDATIAMAICSKWFYGQYDTLNKIGVTGTKGKTTTLNFIKDILEENDKTPAYLSTIDFYTGKSSGKSHNTTPESVDIYSCIKDAAESNIKYLVMEVSSQAIKKNRVYDMDYELGIITNIGCDHVSPLEHKDFEDYFNCKLKFLKMCKKVIVYKHIDHYDRIIKELKDKEIITYGLTKDCTYYIKDIENNNGITSFNVVNNGKTRNFKIKMVGNFNVLNATSAIAVADHYNISFEKISKGLIKTEVLGRMNIYDCNGITVIVDYAHNYISGKAFCSAIKNDYKGKNLKLVFGCPGDRGVNRRREMAEISNEYASYVYITMEDPQSKDVNEIAKEVASYLTVPHTIITDRKTAIEQAIKDSTKQDIVAILGKGDEDYQIINNEYVFYESDVEVVKNIANQVLEGLS